MSLRNSMFLSCLISIVRLTDTTTYLSELMVNNTVEFLREIDLNAQLGNFIAEQERYISRLNSLRTYLGSEENYLANNYGKRKHPGNLLKLVRQCVLSQYKYIYKETGTTLPPFNETFIAKLVTVLPGRQELPKTARGLLRLMEYYQFPLEDLLQGNMGPLKVKALKYDEVVDLALSSKEGFEQELDTEGKRATCSQRTLTNVLDMIQIAEKKAVKIGDRHNAKKIKRATFEILQTSYNFINCSCSEQMMSLLRKYRSILDENEIAEKDDMCRDIEPLKCNKIFRPVNRRENQAQWLCRQAWLEIINGNNDDYMYLNNAKENTGLKCHLKHDHSSLLYKGGKIEEIFAGKFMIKLAYDVITDNEIQYIKDIGLTHLDIASIKLADKNFTAVTSFGRTSRTFRMDGLQMHPLTHLRSRLEGLFDFLVSKKSAENLKIGHYGPSASFYTHIDQQTDNDTVNDRMATIIVYLDDSTGGVTIFDDIGLSVVPKKGSAVMFPLYYKNGTMIKDLPHTSCPVIYGEKWIITQWVNKFGNEFKNPCSLNWYE